MRLTIDEHSVIIVVVAYLTLIIMLPKELLSPLLSGVKIIYSQVVMTALKLIQLFIALLKLVRCGMFRRTTTGLIC